MNDAIDLSGIPLEGFMWDKGNEDKNRFKHQVSTQECEEVFVNTPLHFFRDPKHSQHEERFIAYGRTGNGRSLTLVFTIRNKHIRVISARDQNKKERRAYEKAQTNSEV